MALTSIESSILKQLELNSRTPFSKVGKIIRSSEQRVSYNVNSMIKKGILKGFYTRIDYAKLGVLNFRVYFKVNYITETKFQELINYLTKEKHTSLIESCGGRYDLICTFFTLNPSQFNKTLRSIMEQFPDQLQNYSILTTIIILGFGRKFLLNNEQAQENSIGGDTTPAKLDDIDLKLLNLISGDARASSVELGKKLSITPKTVINRIKALQKKEVIKNFGQLLDLSNSGYNSIKFLIKYHNVTSKLENQLLTYMKFHPNIKFAIKTIGEWDLEIEAQTKTSKELRKFEIEIRQKFGLLIKDIQSIPLYDVYKKNFFPEFLLN